MTTDRQRGIASQPRVGRRTVGGQTCPFKSAWEANWARYLEWLRQEGIVWRWQYEPATFWFANIRSGTNRCTPDFKVVFMDGHVEWHEIKGWDYPKGRTARRRLGIRYPNIYARLRLVTEPAYRVVEQQVGPLLPDWEWPGQERPEPAHPHIPRQVLKELRRSGVSPEQYLRSRGPRRRR